MLSEADWRAFETELAAQPTPAPFWWRDDDAIEQSAALEQLLSLSAAHNAPLTLATIPSRAQPSLPRAAHGTLARICVHGWRHENHAPHGEKKSEFRPHRPLEQRLNEARDGLLRVQEMFGAQSTPIFTPPWNRMGDDLPPHLAPLGYNAVSTFGPRPQKTAAPGLAWLNTHIDPIYWRESRSLRPDILQIACAVLAARRSGAFPLDEPIGLLTHHLVHDAVIWAFAKRFTLAVSEHPNAQWAAL